MISLIAAVSRQRGATSARRPRQQSSQRILTPARSKISSTTRRAYCMCFEGIR
jgi:hypothetical protein